MRATWVWVEMAARLLQRDDRESVLGDLLEAGESSWSAMLSVLGLVMRREAQHWKSWKPWVAAFGLTLPSSFMLMGLSVSVSWTFPRVLHSLAEINPHRNLVLYSIRTLVPLLSMLIGCAFVCGFVVASLSRRTLWVSIAACFLPCLFCLERFRIDSLSRFCLLIFLLPAIWGVRMGMRGWRINFGLALLLAAGLTVLSVSTFNHSWPSWLVFVPLLWPSWYMAVLARRTTLTT